MKEWLTRRVVLTRGAWLAGVAAATPATVACGIGTADTTKPAAAVPPANRIFTTWGVQPLPEGIATDKSVQTFQAANPTVKVQVEAVPNSPIDAILTKVQSMLAAGTPPDVTLMRPNYIAALYAGKGLTSLDKYLAREKGLNRDSYFKGALARLTFDNALYGLPSDYWFAVLYYNRDLFQAAGLPLPDANWTWDNYLDAAKKLTADTGTDKRYGAQWPDWQTRVRDNGVDILDAKETTCLLDQVPAVDAI
jgi:multiple sugar transport system substrate-binding protein